MARFPLPEISPFDHPVVCLNRNPRKRWVWENILGAEQKLVRNGGSTGALR
jgi:hypothetical protein